MNATETYTPKTDSLAGRVCQYFVTNEDEELSAADLAVKFDVPRSSVSALLASAIGAGLLRRVPGQTMPFYAAGTNIARLRPPPPPVAAPTAKAAPAVPASVFAAGAEAAKAPKRQRKLLPPFDPKAIEVKTGVPIPLPRNHREASAKSSYQQLLERLPVGGMVELETTRAKSLLSCAKKLGIRGLTTRLLDDEGQRTGVWRTA